MNYEYDQKYFKSGMIGWHGASYPVISAHLRQEMGKVDRAIDFGAGDGFYGENLTVEAAILDGADISGELNSHPNGKHYEHFHVVDLASAHAPETIGRDQYNFLFSSEVIEHVPDYRMFLKNAAAILAPGGKLFLTTTTFSCALPIVLQHHPRALTPSAGWNFVRGWFGSESARTRFQMILWGWTKGHYHGFSKGQLRRALCNSGLVVERIEYLHIMPFVDLKFFDNPFSSSPFPRPTRAIMQTFKHLCRALNFVCRKFNIYAPNVLLIASKHKTDEA
jgi:SAM-dependent methyltransferase